MSANSVALEEIIVELGRNAIDLASVRRWMQTNNIEAMGALMSFLTEEQHVQRVHDCHSRTLK